MNWRTSLNFTQHVESPTRANNLLDVLASSSPADVADVSVVDAGQLSDHRLITARLATGRQRSKVVVYTSRNLKSVDPVVFENLVRQSQLFEHPAATVDEYADQLRMVVTSILDRMAPERTRARRLVKPESRWLSSEAVAAKRHRRRLERAWLLSRSEDDRIEYRRACRSANKLINESRANFFRSQLSDCRNNPRER